VHGGETLLVKKGNGRGFSPPSEKFTNPVAEGKRRPRPLLSLWKMEHGELFWLAVKKSEANLHTPSICSNTFRALFHQNRLST